MKIPRLLLLQFIRYFLAPNVYLLENGNPEVPVVRVKTVMEEEVVVVVHPYPVSPSVPLTTH